MTKEKQFEVLSWAFSFLREHHREENIAEILLQHHLDISRAMFYTMMQEEVPTFVREKFIRDVKEHALTGKPVQHIIGYEYFYGRKFYVDDNVLIPRFETEELVEHMIQKIRLQYADKPLEIVDLGTGSGIIAITLAIELPHAKVYATDISNKALQVARTNTNYHQTSVHFLQGDFLDPIIQNQINPQVIVSNPPYIKHSDKLTLSDTVKDYDPEIALFADHNGLAAYEAIMSQIKKLKKQNERQIYFEIGYEQANEVTRIIKESYPHSIVETIKDINKKDRIISATV